MKGKFRFFAVVFAFALAIAGGMLVAQPAQKVYATGEQSSKHIDITPIVSCIDNTLNYADANGNLLLYGTETGLQLRVDYKIVANTGVNAMLLIPSFDSCFSINTITVNESALGVATITGDYVEDEEESLVTKIFIDSNVTYNKIYEDENEVAGDHTMLLSIVFDIDLSDENSFGEHNFGLVLSDVAEYDHNEYSNALVDNQDGTTEEVLINIVEADSIYFYRYQPTHIYIGYNYTDQGNDVYKYTYSGQSLAATKVESFSAEPTGVEYTYDGSSQVNPVVQWYGSDGVTALNGAPVNAGTYYVSVSASGHGIFLPTESEKREVRITPLLINITIADKSSDYGDAIVPLTHNYTGNDLTITLSTDATSSSQVGTYPITGSYSGSVGGNYTVNFVEGVYTISPKAITIKANDQQAEFTGSEPTVDQSEYTVTGTSATLSGVSITKAAGVNVGPYTLTPSYSNGNYSITFTTGTFTITSKSVLADEVKAYFQGVEKVYNGSNQDLLGVDSNKPSWITYTSSNNMQKNAGNYIVSYTATVDGNHTIGGESQVVGTVSSSIAKKGLTITVNNAGHTYGQSPSTITSDIEGLVAGDTVVIVYSLVHISTSEPVTLSSSTNVGSYYANPSLNDEEEDGANYYVTEYVTGTYTVSPATPVLEVVAADLSYHKDWAPSFTVTLNGNEVTSGYTVVYTKFGSETPVEFGNNVTHDIGTYIVQVSVPASGNYSAASTSDNFDVSQTLLALPTFTYAGGTVTWTAVTTDINGIELAQNTTVSYSIGGVAYSSSYTASSTSALTFTVSSDNGNYLAKSVSLKAVHSVSYDAGIVSTASNMPETQYLFDGELATAPQSNPSKAGYTFNGWLKGSSAPDYSVPVTENWVIVAQWEGITYTMTVIYTGTNKEQASKQFTVDYGTEIAISTYNLKLQAGITDADMLASYDLAGKHYVFNNLWSYKVTGSSEYIQEEVHQVPVNAYDNYTFVAVYTVSDNTYSITYLVSTLGGQYADITSSVPAANREFNYGATVAYHTLSAPMAWLTNETWFTNQERTISAPETMPENSITVYGAVVFNIGLGDVNGDGLVSADDILAYRKWIVGGYNINTVDAEGLVEAADEYDEDNLYFIQMVADVNGDTNLDIRDVAVTRMALVTGYNWDKESGYNVTGGEIIRNVHTADYLSLVAAINDGKKVTLTDDVTSEAALSIVTTNNVTLDLNGHTLTVDAFSLLSTSRSSLTVKNGTIVTSEGITISAPYGNVVLTNLTGFDANGEVNLAAANHSLHLDGNVKFYEGAPVEVEPEQEPQLTAATINVLEGTHIVIEPAAVVEVAHIKVTQEDFETVATEAITVTSYSENVTPAQAQGLVLGNVVVDSNEISTREQLVAAASKGGFYTLVNDISYSGRANRVVFVKNTTLDLNGHSITSTNEIPLTVQEHATLTIGDSVGTGEVNGREACVMAFDGSSFVINGGIFTCTDNFVFGTNGNPGNGGNTITINAGTFNGEIASAGYIACGVYVANDDIVTVNGGTFNITNGVGILARSGSTTVANGVVLNVTGNGVAGKVGDSRVVLPSGEKLVLDLAANYPGGDPEITNNSSYDVCVIADSAADINSNISSVSKFALAADIQPSTPIAFSSNATVYGNGYKLKAEISGNGTVVFNNVYTTNISVVKSGFSGTLIFNGGVLDSDRNDGKDSDAAFYSSSNSNASFEFRNMSISANITKGIKIYNAKNIVIDGCVFDATKLHVMANGTNSDIQSLSLVDIQIDSVATNITINNSRFAGAPQGSTAVPESVYGFNMWPDSDTGAAIKLKVEKGAQFGNVVITNNIFENNYRDIVLGTGPYLNQLQTAASSASNGRSGDGLQYNKIDANWTISGNSTTLTSGVVESRGVATLSYIGGPDKFNKYTTYVGCVGAIYEGVAIWTIADAFVKVNGVWCYSENGTIYNVTCVNGQAVLTPIQQ